MRKKQTVLAGLLVLFGFAASAGAMDIHSYHGTAQQESTTTDSEQVMLENNTSNGVMAMAHLQDITKKMVKYNQDKTHHLMIMFKDASSETIFDSGLVAVKVIDPAGTESPAVKMLGMDGSFGADLVLAQKGKYTFEVGTKLGDNTTRQFRFQHTMN
mgnify:FL=1